MDRFGALLAAMRAHRGRASVQLYGCGHLNELVALNPENNVVLIAKAGGIEDVVMAMRIHCSKRNAKLQQHGFRVLCNITNFAAGDDDVVLTLFAKAGGIVVVCAGMRSQPSDADVQHRGCRALSNIAFDNQILVAKLVLR